jgi:hypothetical protein
MSDRFRSLSMEQLTSWAFTELEQKGSILNVPASAVFAPRPDDRFRRREFGVELDTILEEHSYAGGRIGGAIPTYRLPQAQIAQDLAVLERLGVELRYGVRVGDDVTG